MKKILLILSVLSFGIIGCTDLTEEVFEAIPSDKYPEDENQVATMTVNAYATLRTFADDEGWWFLAQEISGDGIVFPTRDADWDDGGKWRVMHQHSWSDDVEGVNRMWSLFWNGITTCNQLLFNLNNLPSSDLIEQKKKEVEVLRALFYYYIIDNYGDAPYITSFVDAPEKPFKASRAAIFDSITNSLENNLPLLKAIDNKYMATRYLAFALLAKLYANAEIYTGTAQWQKALQYTDSVIAGPYIFATDFKEPFVTNNENSSEIIFSIPYHEDNFQGFRLHMRTLHYQHNLTYDMNVGPWNGCCAVPTFFDTYDDTDLRKNAWYIYGPQYDSKGSPIIESTTSKPLNIDPNIPAVRMDATYTVEQIRTSGARIGKYEIKKGAKENLSNDFPLFRLSDFYLLKAELEIRLGNNGDSWVNPIRKRAGVNDFTNATLDDILAERGRELVAEGIRRQDLIRYKKFTNMWWGKGDNQGGVAGDPKVNTFPIPKWATEANTNLLEDPR